MINEICRHIDFDLKENKMSHLESKQYWTEHIRKIDVDGIIVRVYFKGDQYIELFKKKLMQAEKMVDEKHAEKWIGDCIIGGINKIKLDK